MTKLRKASKRDWLKSFRETLADTIDSGFSSEAAIEISNVIVRARKDIEPYAGRRAALAADVSAHKIPGGGIKARVDIDLNLVPTELQEKLRLHPNTRK